MSYGFKKYVLQKTFFRLNKGLDEIFDLSLVGGLPV